MTPEQIAKTNAVVERLLTGIVRPKVLEAGCGSLSLLRMPPDATVVGMDISATQLEKNQRVHERILRDIQSEDFPENEFDLIVCYNVLEHVRHPERAIRNFVKALKEGGVAVIAFPNVLSLKGLLTKFTPFWFHVWVYRVLLKDDTAGVDGNAPFPTPIRFSLRPGAVRQFALQNGLSIEYCSVYESDMQRHHLRGHFFVNLAMTWVGAAVRVLTLGKVDVNLTDCMIVVRKKALKMV